jgi:hypothetical protein
MGQRRRLGQREDAQLEKARKSVASRFGVPSWLESQSLPLATGLTALDEEQPGGPISSLNHETGMYHSPNGSEATRSLVPDTSNLSDKLVFDLALEEVPGNIERPRSILE